MLCQSRFWPSRRVVIDGMAPAFRDRRIMGARFRCTTILPFLYDRGCVPSYTVAMIEFDGPPWDRFLDKLWGRFICPGCGQTLDMHVSHGPGAPGTERFREAR